MRLMQQKLPQLDGVRGLAIFLVILHNTSTMKLPGLEGLVAYGWMGVDLFFVLSGFLITGILLDARNSLHFYRNFYARRCLRIWPLYYSLLFFMFVAIPLVHPSLASKILDSSRPCWSYLLFLQNFLTSSPNLAAGPLGVTWSLAVEELFCLVWAPFPPVRSSVYP
jgi:peptidoglycan/LPS O-acetylase OafA/YrhL